MPAGPTDHTVSDELPSASVIVATAVMHLYREVLDVEAPSQVRLRAAVALADNAERWLASAGEGEAAKVLKLVADATRGT